MAFSDFSGFAVFDLETTGLSPGRNHRIIEIGIVRLDEDFDVVEEWETLINPERDIGATDIHGLTASDLVEAPTFVDLMADIWHRFEGAVPVAHNISFDRQFIVSEFSRAGVELEDFSGICTMRLAAQLGVSGGRRRLVDLCHDLLVDTSPSHSAGNDARMCADILRKLSKTRDISRLFQPVTCPELWRRRATPLGITRQKARDTPIQSPLQILAQRLNGSSIVTKAESGQLDEYLLVLDHVLEDRVIDDTEVEELASVADAFGFSGDDLQDIHERYLARLVALVLSDGIVTDDERRDLNRVAGLLGVSAEKVEQLLVDSPESHRFTSENLSGKTVCFTGELRCCIAGETLDHPRAEDIAVTHGLTPRPSVTKKLDILVVADPHTASRKAEKARKYGVRIIAERPFWQKLGVSVE